MNYPSKYLLAASGVCAALSGGMAEASAQSERPDFLVVVCEDISPFLGCYGDPAAVTPNLDRFAGEAVRHSNMFTTVGVSSPSRYSLITGRFPSADGANYMRATTYDKDFEVVPPAGVKCFTEYLRAEGYYCVNRAKTDCQFTPPMAAWDESGAAAHWKNAPDGAPFYAVFNLAVTHESQIWRRTDLPLAVSPADVRVPPYYPDNAATRHDIAVMYSNIAAMDAQFQELYDELNESGRSGNAVVIFYSDNGGPLPRAKREIMDSGTRVPFMIKLPDGAGAGKVDDRLCMFADIPATILSLAGVAIPGNMHGQAMYGPQSADVEPRKYVFGASDRFDAEIEKRASIRDGRYLYIRNYMPFQSVYRPVEYRLQMPMMRNMVELYAKGELDDAQSAWFDSPAAAEALFDCEADPHNVRNLAGSKEHRKILRRMRRAFEKEWIERYNSRWLRYSEADFVAEMNPGGRKPVVEAPQAVIEDNTLTISNYSPDISYSYRIINEVGASGWRPYKRLITEIPTGAAAEVAAERIGYEKSEVTVYNNK